MTDLDCLCSWSQHVRDDAGHSSGAITDRYIDVELQARAKSAAKKKSMQSEK